MITLAAAAIAVISCGSSQPLVAKNYRPHPISTASEAILAAKSQMEELTTAQYSLERWVKAFKVQHISEKWILEGQLGSAPQQIQLNAKDGRVLCGFVID